MDWKLNIRTNGLHSFKVEGAFLKIMWRFQEILKDGKGRTFEKVEWRGHSNHHTGETDWDWMKRTMGFNSWHPKCLSKKNEIDQWAAYTESRSLSHCRGQAAPPLAGLATFVSVCLLSLVGLCWNFSGPLSPRASNSKSSQVLSPGQGRDRGITAAVDQVVGTLSQKPAGP